MDSLIIVFMGEDRPGIVQKLTDTVARHDGNWQESRMSRLGGYFSGTARVLIAEDQLEGLEKSLAALPDLTVLVRAPRELSPAATGRLMNLDIIGPDRPGILQDVTNHLLRYGVNVIEMETSVRPAPMSGELNFVADAVIEVPAGVDLEELDEQLDTSARRLALDILLEDPEAG